MSVATISSAIALFTSRLDTLAHLLDAGAAHFGVTADEGLSRRLAADMLPLGAQVVFTCNQPHNFCLWLTAQPACDLDPVVPSLASARRCVDHTRARLAAAVANETLLDAPIRLELGGGLYADLSGREYLDDFLLPNFYFHLVTAYAILRKEGVALGKRDYMLHLLPRVSQRAD